MDQAKNGHMPPLSQHDPPGRLRQRHLTAQYVGGLDLRRQGLGDDCSGQREHGDA